MDAMVSHRPVRRRVVCTRPVAAWAGNVFNERGEKHTTQWLVIRGGVNRSRLILSCMMMRSQPGWRSLGQCRRYSTSAANSEEAGSVLTARPTTRC